MRWSRLRRLGRQTKHKGGVLGTDRGFRVFQAQIAVSLHPGSGDNQVERIGKCHGMLTSCTLPGTRN